MKCPLCNDDEDRTLDQMDDHLENVHHLDEEERIQLGEHYFHLVQDQIILESRDRVKRLWIVKKAVELIRENPRYWPTAVMIEKVLKASTRDPHGGSPRKDWQTWPLTYGFYSLIEYIETGRAEKILNGTLRRAVKSVINSEKTQE